MFQNMFAKKKKKCTSSVGSLYMFMFIPTSIMLPQGFALMVSAPLTSIALAHELCRILKPGVKWRRVD